MNAATIVTKTRTGYTVTTVRHFEGPVTAGLWLQHMRELGAPADAAAEHAVASHSLRQDEVALGMAESYLGAK
jgi:hypothetical protein